MLTQRRVDICKQESGGGGGGGSGLQHISTSWAAFLIKESSKQIREREAGNLPAKASLPDGTKRA